MLKKLTSLVSLCSFSISVSCTPSIAELTPRINQPSFNQSNFTIQVPDSNDYLTLDLAKDYDSQSNYILHSTRFGSYQVAESAFTKDHKPIIEQAIRVQTSDEGHLLITEDVSDALPAERNILLFKQDSGYTTSYLIPGVGKKPKYAYAPILGITLLNNNSALVGTKLMSLTDIQSKKEPYTFY